MSAFVSALTDTEIETLDKAKAANEWWFRAMLKAASIMVPRREKYSGAGDPYTNFIIATNIIKQHPKLKDVWNTHLTFFVYRVLKLARELVDAGDFPDESMMDTKLDGGNYNFLDAGWSIREQEEGT